MVKRHSVFISYHHEKDEACKARFVRLMGDDIIDRSVNLGDIIDDSEPDEAVLQQIREDHLSLVSVTIVLLGRDTWRRKYVDWEIGASLRDTNANPRGGLLGILLPGHPSYRNPTYNPHLIPKRLADNCFADNPFARVYKWTDNALTVKQWIHTAFLRRKRTPDPDISRLPFARNQRGNCSYGCQSCPASGGIISS